MASFTVRIVDDEQNPVSGARVVLGFTSILRGITTEDYTDSGGYAYFDGYDEGEAEVFIRGSSYGIYYYRDGDSITITL